MCFWLPYLPPENVIARLYLVRLAPALGACLLLTAAFCGSRTAWLRSRACQWLGQISYGVYVWHAVILAGIVRALPAGVPPLALAPAGIAGTLVIGHLSYHLVERPVLTWGRRQIRGRSHQAGRSLAILGANSAPSPSRQ
jgi:peptidoglycan/LPS O-acetylase OafA/YrhL